MIFIISTLKELKLVLFSTQSPHMYILETYEINSPNLVYCCHITTKALKGKACRLIVDFFNPKSQNEDLDNDEDTEIKNILEKYITYNLVVAVFEQSFPHCIMFHKELSNFFVIDNITFVIFEPNSMLKWRYNIFDISNYEYFEGDVMYKYINSTIMNVFLPKKYQTLDSSDKIEEITEEISDLNLFDQNSRIFCKISNITPDFHIEQERPTKDTSLFYTFLLSQKENEVRKKKVFYKAYNIGLGEHTELSINMVLNVYLCSNDTIRISLSLTDLAEKNKQDPVNHIINFIKQTLNGGAKLYSELVRYKDFFFMIQISMVCENYVQPSAYCVDLSCTTNNESMNAVTDDIPSPVRLWSFMNIDQKINEAKESSIDELGSQTKRDSQRSSPNFAASFKQCYKPIVSLFGSVGEEVLRQSFFFDEDLIESKHESVLLHRKTFFDDSSNLVIAIEVRTDARKPGGKSRYQILKVINNFSQHLYYIEEGFTIVILEPETSNRQEFSIFFKDCFTRREMEFFSFDDMLSMKRLAVNMIEERILISKSESGEYKIETLTTEEIEKGKVDQIEPSISSEADDAKEIGGDDKEPVISEGVRTITEEHSKAPSESNDDSQISN